MNNITNEEKEVIEELRKRTVNDATPKMLEDETVFYRFAKARDFNLVEAEAMLRKHISWRKQFQIDNILTDYKPPEVLLEYIASSFICFDKEGNIVRIQDWGRLDAKGLCNVITKTEMIKFCVYLIEKDKAAVLRRGGNFRKPIFYAIYDFEDFTYAKAVHLTSVQYLIYGLKTFFDNYPELVKFITVINAPLCFAWFYNAVKSIFPSTVAQKMRIYGTEGWKQALLKDIDADDLPAYLGGNKTDPDGSPLCETFIQRGKPLPKRYYKQNGGKRLILGPDAETCRVMPFSKKEITLEVKEENSFLEWEFEITQGDINFSLRFMGEISDNFEAMELIPEQRIDTCLEAEKGCFKCEKQGNYTIIFDNSYSWFHSKEVHYRAIIRNPKNSQLYK
ncbi:unnamed protein product [Larinioides sclopetarius]|uniref:SEC14-like protein 2 n=1 Tax=Larinioides sclopetarius TaxID=280406 RepID=A0AAV2A4Y1_9ARAC